MKTWPSRTSQKRDGVVDSVSGVELQLLPRPHENGRIHFPHSAAGLAAPVLSPVETKALALNDWIERIRRAWLGSADQTLELARLIRRAKRSLPYGGWNRLWRSGQMPFSKRKGEMLALIGGCVEGMDAQNSACLPAAWNTMYYLARLGRPAVERLIQEGRIHAGLTVREARALLAEFQPERRTKTPRSKLAVRLKRFSVWVRAEQGHWSMTERALVRRRLLSLAREMLTPGDISSRAAQPLTEEFLVDSGRTNSSSML